MHVRVSSSCLGSILPFDLRIPHAPPFFPPAAGAPQWWRPGAVIVPALHQGEEISIAQWTTSPPQTWTTASTSTHPRYPHQPPRPHPRAAEQPPSPPPPAKRPLRPQNSIAGGRKRRASGPGGPRPPTPPSPKRGRTRPPPHPAAASAGTAGSGLAAKRVKWRDLERPAPTPPPVPPPPPPPHLHPLSIRSEEVGNRVQLGCILQFGPYGWIHVHIMCTSINMMTKTTTIALNALTMLIACFLIFPGAIILAAGYHENTSTVPLSFA